ncbi:heparan-alpha-glucosaminide N-acetyltransferase-like [Limulus polyphemus]|uniref:Heparan-alpha-glucosaminide N-acetyltransferase-like n=1 Tax=Limulus polyphemus TaxID=6850 RepID=A0ABM1BVH5_LIMPO|nr:heparan-alpha-glucosaminide N-acetyltransferase-like [Limulus polyphemus]
MSSLRQQVCQSLLGRKRVLEICTAEKENSQQTTPPQKTRLCSLDTFRGIALLVMIFVNYGGGRYWFFEHAPWNGLYLADLVFPWFIWIMGVSMAFSTRSLLRKSVPRWKIFKNILKRSCILFALGIILNTYGGYNNLQKIRIPGVLQRFGISYFVVSSVHLLFTKPNDIHQKKIWASVRDILPYWLEWLIMFGILLTHILLTFLLEVPGCPKGYLGPGGIHNGGDYFNCTGGAAGYIDRVILGEAHIYQHPTIKVIYLTELPYDPEGILGFLTSIFLVFLGLQAGKILLTYQDWKPRIGRWLIWGTIIGLIAIILSKASINDGWIPINKNLWSISFIFATGAMGFYLLSICYFIIDVKKWWTGAPFFFSGMNSILIYVGHSLTSELFPWTWHVGQTHWEHLAVDLWGVTLWVIISIWLYYKKLFLAV